MIRAFLFLAFLQCSSVGFSQTYDSAQAHMLYEKGIYFDTINEYQKSLNFFKVSYEIFDSLGYFRQSIDSYLYFLNGLNKLEKTKEFSGKLTSFELKLDSLKHAHPDTSFLRTDLSIERFKVILNIKKSQPWEAEKYCSIVDSLANANLPKLKDRKFILSDNFRELAKVKYMQGSYQACIEANAQAIKLNKDFEELGGKNKDGYLLLPLILNIQAYQKLNENEKAVLDLQSLRENLGKVISKKIERSFEVYESHFKFYLDKEKGKGNADSTFKYLSLIRELNSDGRYKSIFPTLKSMYSIQFLDFEKANVDFEKAKDVIIKEKLKNDFSSFLLSSKMAQRLFLEHHENDCIEIIEEVFLNIDPLNGSTETFDFKNNQQTLILDLLELKTQAFYNIYKKTRNNSDLNNAWEAAQKCAVAIQYLRGTFNSDFDQIFLMDKNYGHYENALLIAFEYYNQGNNSWIDTAFSLMEQCKSLNLLEINSTREKIEKAIIPLFHKEEYLDLSAQIDNIQYEILLIEQNKKPDLDLIMEKRSELQVLRDSLQKVMKSISDEYSNLQFNELPERQSWSIVKEESAQKGIGFIEYFTGAKNLFIISTQGENEILIKEPIPDTFSIRVNSYLKNIEAYGQDRSFEQRETYSSEAQYFYQLLIKPILFTLPNRVQVIPDGALRTLSFNTLLSSAPEKKKNIHLYPFLLRLHAFSYNYSYALSKQTSGASVKPLLNVLAMAPLFYGEDKLNFNREEVKGIQRFIETKSYTGKSATKEKFLKEIQRSELASILHLSTHAQANQEVGASSFIRFYEGKNGLKTSKLTAFELSQLRMPFHLAVLSACETAKGQSIQGEGVVGLSRAFFQSGVKSLIASLWQVNDASSCTIQENFYRELKKEIPKDEALQNAQIKYLMGITPNEKVRAHPFYWAAMIPVGDVTSFTYEKKRYFWYWILGIGVIGLSLMFLIWRKRKSESKKRAA